MRDIVGTDGVDHINIYSAGATLLGRKLSNMSPFSFSFEGIAFNSVEQAYHYYKFKEIDERIAQQILMCGDAFKAKLLAKEGNCEETKEVVSSQVFQKKIREVITKRVLLDRDLCILLRNSTLPLKHYYCFKNGYKKDLPEHSWIVDTIEDIRYTLQRRYLIGLLGEYGDKCFNQKTAPPNSVYCGRGKGCELGNPFPSESKDECDVIKSIMKFRGYLIRGIKNTSDFDWITSLKGKPLKRFCNNGTKSFDTGGKLCHTLIIANCIDNFSRIKGGKR